MKKKFIVIDGHHLIYRAFYAISNMSTSDWILVNAVFWVASMILNIIEKEAPDYLSCTFDLHKSFRHDEDSNYKAQRKQCPNELKPQFDIIYEMINAMGIPSFSSEWFEADDAMWTISEINSKNDDITTYIVTWDMDMMQLVNDGKVIVVFPNKWYRDPIYFNEEKVFEKYELTPSQIIDYKVIAWDSSDNMKGIEWIWEIWAKKLIKQYWNLESIYNNLDSIKGKVKENLIKWKWNLEKWKNMVIIRRDIPLDNYSLEGCKFNRFSDQTVDFFKKYEFNSLIRRLDKSKPKVDVDNQLSLF